MRSKCSSRLNLILASLLLVWGGSFRASHAVAAPPTVTITGLEVNGTPQPCSTSTTAMGGDTVCVLFDTSQSGFAEAFLGPNNVRFCSGPVTPRPGNPWRCCFRFVSTPITGPRTITVRVTNSTTGSGSAMCTFTVGSSTQNQLTGTIRPARGQNQTSCNTTFFNGEPISFVVTSSLPAHATVMLTKPGGMPVTIFDGNVSAGTTTVASGTIGPPAGARTLTLTLTSGSMTATDTCGYNVVLTTAPTNPG